MSQLLLILIPAVWLLGASAPLGKSAGGSQWTLLFLGVYLLMVLVMVSWSRRLAGMPSGPILHRRIGRFNFASTVCKTVIPLWLAAGIFGPSHWREAVNHLLAPVSYPLSGGGYLLHFPALLVGILPALLAWVGLIWAQYPIDNVMHETSLLSDLDQGLPVHRPPTLKRFLVAAIRQRLGLVLAPIFLILIFEDCLAIVIHLIFGDTAVAGQWMQILLLPATVAIYLLAPLLFRVVLGARPLPDSPLRTRLKAICSKSGLKYRDILLWHTDFSLGNAAVIGLLPQLRYILLSDLLIETMTDEQIEAVFAHEVGHIVHRHVGWFMLFFLMMFLFAAGPGQTLTNYFPGHDGDWADWTLSGFMFVAAITLFGYVSRRFERQADVYAARMIQSNWGTLDRTTEPPPSVSDPHPPYSTAPAGSYVGEYGAAIMSSALERVARINHMPTHRKGWRHPSIDSRKRELLSMSSNPAATLNFDRGMRRLYTLLLLILAALAIWSALASFPFH